MLEYDRIYANKSNGWLKCICCHYWYILEKDFRFQIKVYDGCFKMFLKKCSYKQGVPGLQAFTFYVVTVNDEHTKARFKRKFRDLIKDSI